MTGFVPPCSFRRTIVVCGLHSGIGKTLLAEHIVSLVPDIAAIKTTIHNGPATVTADDRDIMVEGKDTWRLRNRGARIVVWIRSSEEDLKEALEKACTLIGNAQAVLIEGNSVMRWIKPDVALFVCDGQILQGHIKPSRIEALRKATAIIVNRHTTRPQNIDDVVALCRTINPQSPVYGLDLSDGASVQRFLEPILEKWSI